MGPLRKRRSKINPAIGTEGSKTGHFLTIKMIVTKKYEFSWTKGMCSPVRICTGVNRMSGSKKVIVGPKSSPDSPRSPVLTHNSLLVACKKALMVCLRKGGGDCTVLSVPPEIFIDRLGMNLSILIF